MASGDKLIVSPLQPEGELRLDTLPQAPECLDGVDGLAPAVLFANPADAALARYLMGDRSPEVVAEVVDA